ncbi:uncharacterized protein LTHEOB_5072 [Lasiodiplodia theobromae]|uniref:uncharacterized protein n=1 Tax=Lasiodiplodia theobromae TaxID=45133 RepID=UPI0015C35094|nr:uncharacterized protein LTHEOB_5072 [Lasiodiplodia theobromae]KAF4545813.1 hypothetical protein LTHEOB_5072 [Lasiodiplodia theobromae]
MDAPIYEDDLTTIHGRHAAPLVRLRDRTATDVIALSTAVTEERLQAALADLNDVATIIDDMFVDGEIEDPDIPFGELRLAWIGGLKLSGSAADLGFGGDEEEDDIHSYPTNGMHPYDYSDDDDTDGDTDVDDASSSGYSDSGVDSLSLMELASKCATTTFTDLRHLYALHYAIHIHRLDRLLLRLPPGIFTPVDAATSGVFSTAPSALDGPHRPEPIRQPPPPPPGAVIADKAYEYSIGGAGAPLSKQKEAEYARVLADEIARVAEYKQAVVGVLVREIAGCGGVGVVM